MCRWTPNGPARLRGSHRPRTVRGSSGVPTSVVKTTPLSHHVAPAVTRSSDCRNAGCSECVDDVAGERHGSDRCATSAGHVLRLEPASRTATSSRCA